MESQVQNSVKLSYYCISVYLFDWLIDQLIDMPLDARSGLVEENVVEVFHNYGFHFNFIDYKA